MPLRIVGGEEGVRHIECLRTSPGEPGKDGRSIPIPVEGSEFLFEIDHVIVAVGESSDLSCLPAHLYGEGERLAADENGAMPQKGVFSGGDAATWAGKVSEAIASGKRGATAIYRYLEQPGDNRVPICSEVVGFEELNPDYLYEAPRNPGELLRPERAARCFDEVCGGYTESDALKEARRCLGCAVPPAYNVDRCRGCVNCADRCPAGAITIDPRPEPITVGVDPGRSDQHLIYSICKRAKMHPKQIICYCTNTTAGEIVAAILEGAKTAEEISLATGARTGCTVLCIQSIVKLIEASGLTLELSSTHQHYGKTFTVWDLDPAIKSRYEKYGYHFDDDIKLIEKVFEKK